MPAQVSYIIAREGDAQAKNIMAYPCPDIYVFPLPAQPTTIYMWQGGTFPSVGDVKQGVDYGPTGAEYEGIYSPGAGGNTYSRTRVVNA